jgi:hypothetical protein
VFLAATGGELQAPTPCLVYQTPRRDGMRTVENAVPPREGRA